MKDGAETNPDWEELWSQFHDVFGRNPARAYRYQRIAEQLSRISNFKLNIVADFGCGTGELVSFLGPKFPQLKFLGLDTSEAAIRIASLNYPKYEFMLMHQPSKMRPRVLETRFDVVICSEVLEHLDEPNKVLILISHLLRKDGKLIITVPAGPISFFDTFIGHKRHYTRDTLVSLLKESGFSDIEISRSGFPGINLIRVASILRGKRILKDLKKSRGNSKFLDIGFKLMERLLQISIDDSRFGWQLVVSCRKS